MKDKITFEEFLEIQKKLEIKIGKINSAERVPKSHGLRLIVDFGTGDVRSVFTNLGKNYDPQVLVGVNAPFITNLAPVEIKGVNSEAMIIIGVGLDGEDQIDLGYYEIGTKIL